MPLFLARRYPALPAPKLAVACAAVKRVHAQKDYSPHNYEVSDEGNQLASTNSIDFQCWKLIKFKETPQ